MRKQIILYTLTLLISCQLYAGEIHEKVDKQVLENAQSFMNSIESRTDIKKIQSNFGKEVFKLEQDISLNLGKIETPPGLEIKEEFDPANYLNVYKNGVGKQKGQCGGQPLNQLLIFVSSSMPKSSLEDWAQQVRISGGVLVLRGFINDSFKDSADFIKGLSDQGVGAIVDPKSYKIFNITHVPTIVVLPDLHKCLGEECKQTPIHDKISGEITLKYGLEQIRDYGYVSNMAAKRILTLMQGEV